MPPPRASPTVIDAELTALGAIAAAARIRDGSLTPTTLVAACLERIAAREETVRAWTHLDPEAALVQARARDTETAGGPLHGVPVAVKDVFDTHDMPTEYGTPLYAGHRPARDAAVVALARAAGAVVLGKTVTTEFATFAAGATRNPHDPTRTPGGSSSGSAAAVADGMVPLAFGSQTAGSVIRPASYCGIVGYKPSFGRLPRSGLWPLSDSLDTVGVYARSVDDAALLAAAAGALGGEAATPRPLARPPRIGLYRSPEWEWAEPPMRAAVEAAATALAQAGAEVREVASPPGFEALADAHWTILGYEVARAMAHERAVHGDRLTDGLREFTDRHAALSESEYRPALALAQDARARLEEVFAGVDVVLSAAAPGEAPAGLETTGDPVMNRVWTLLHTPCVTIPAGRGPGGLPLGVQIAGRIGDDGLTLAAARWAAERLQPEKRYVEP